MQASRTREQFSGCYLLVDRIVRTYEGVYRRALTTLRRQVLKERPPIPSFMPTNLARDFVTKFGGMRPCRLVGARPLADENVKYRNSLRRMHPA